MYLMDYYLIFAYFLLIYLLNINFMYQKDKFGIILASQFNSFC